MVEKRLPELIVSESGFSQTKQEFIDFDNRYTYKIPLLLVITSDDFMKGITNVKGWNDNQIRQRIDEVKAQVEWDNTTGSARKWSEVFEKENEHRLALILRLLEELANRKMSITELYLAYIYEDNVDNIQAVFEYANYINFKKYGALFDKYCQGNVYVNTERNRLSGKAWKANFNFNLSSSFYQLQLYSYNSSRVRSILKNVADLINLEILAGRVVALKSIAIRLSRASLSVLSVRGVLLQLLSSLPKLESLEGLPRFALAESLQTIEEYYPDAFAFLRSIQEAIPVSNREDLISFAFNELWRKRGWPLPKEQKLSSVEDQHNSKIVPTFIAEHLSSKANLTMKLAQEEARRLGHDSLGTDHILLGLIAEGTDVAAKALKSMGVTLKEARLRAAKFAGRRASSLSQEIPFTPRCLELLELAVQEAKQLDSVKIGTEHLLLGLLRIEEGVATKILEELGLSPSQLRIQVQTLLQDQAITSVESTSNVIDAIQVKHGIESLHSTQGTSKLAVQESSTFQKFKIDTPFVGVCFFCTQIQKVVLPNGIYKSLSPGQFICKGCVSQGLSSLATLEESTDVICSYCGQTTSKMWQGSAINNQWLCQNCLLRADSNLTPLQRKPIVLVLNRGITDTRNWEVFQLIELLERTKRRIQWENASPQARNWWTAFETDNFDHLQLVVRLAEEVAFGGCTLSDLYYAYLQAETDNMQAIIYYMKFLRLKREEQKRKALRK